MSLVYTAEDLIESVRNRGSVADVSSEGSTDADILRYATEFMYTTLVPEIKKFQAEYFVKIQQDTIVASQQRYRVPRRAVANRLRDVSYLNNGTRQTLPQIAREDTWRFGDSNGSAPFGFYIEGNDLVLVAPEATGGNILEMAYYFRPGQLTKDYRVLATVDTATKTVTTTESLPSGWGTTTLFDVHSAFSGAENKDFDMATTVAGATTVTFTSEIDGSVAGTRALEVGDYITLANEAAVPGVPIEAQPVIVQGAALRLVQATGDVEGVQVHERALAQQIQDLRHIFEDRVAGKTKKISGRGAPLWQQGGVVY